MSRSGNDKLVTVFGAGAPLLGTLLIVCAFSTSVMGQPGPHYAPFKKDGCTGNGLRQYSSRLWGIPWGYSWEKACSETSATVNGVAFSHATRCKKWPNDQHPTEMWGEFDVPDSSCAPHFEPPTAQGCVHVGKRLYTARLWGSNNWDYDCQHTSLDIGSQHFAAPTSCKSDNPFGVGIATYEYGEFEVDDSGCQPRFDSALRGDCESTPGKRLYRALLVDVPERDNANALCLTKQWRMNINGVAYQPTRCEFDQIANGGNEYGYFDVDDSSCQAPPQPPGSGDNHSGDGTAEHACSGFETVRYKNEGSHDEVVWLYDLQTTELTDKGHLAPEQELEVELKPNGQQFELHVVDATLVDEHNASFSDKFNADSSGPDGAVYSTTFTTTYGPLLACSSSGVGYEIPAFTFFGTPPGRNALPGIHRTFATPPLFLFGYDRRGPCFGAPVPGNQASEPMACPRGFSQVRYGATIASCPDSRPCACTNWMSCAQAARNNWGCTGGTRTPFLPIKVRMCVRR